MRERGQQLAPGAVIPPPALTPPPPPAMPTPDRVEVEIAYCTQDLLTALNRYRLAKRVFAARVAQLERQHGPTAKADIAARDDYQRTKAIADCAWWRGEVMAASNALIALRGLAGGDSR